MPFRVREGQKRRRAVGMHTDRENVNDSQTLISDEDLYKSIVVIDESDENFNKI